MELRVSFFSEVEINEYSWSFSEEEDPHLALGIAHESGYVLDMRWCPKGALFSSDQVI